LNINLFSILDEEVYAYRLSQDSLLQVVL